MTVEAEAKERPIIFNGQMVRAILDGTKTQTRRPIKPQPKERPGLALVVTTYSAPDESHALFFRGPTVESPGIDPVAKCPYGVVGDRLWVRETFTYITKARNEYYTHIRPDGCPVELLPKADFPDDSRLACPWTPSIHMPRWASRLILEVTAIRVERVQDITGQDVIAEGFELHPVLHYSKAVLENAPTFEEIWPNLVAAIGSRRVVTYNKKFDARMLYQTGDACGNDISEAVREFFRDRWQRCAMEMYAGFIGKWNAFKGSYRWQPLPGGDHSALGDCRATLAVIKEMAKAVEA